MAIANFGLSTITLATSRIQDEEGKSIVLGSLWGSTPAIIVFLRHFACVTCRGHAKDVWENKEKYEAAGAKLYFIGNGAPYIIKTFKEDLKIENAPIYTDPSLQSFHAAGFKRGFLKALSPKSLINGRKMMNAGHKQGAYSKDQGDLWQLGGIVAVKPGGIVTYHYISEAAGDFPPESDVAEAGQEVPTNS